MAYLRARIRKESELRAYRVYMSDCTQFLVNNMANALGGITVQNRYFDLIDTSAQEEPPDPEEIKERIIGGLLRLEEEE